MSKAALARLFCTGYLCSLCLVEVPFQVLGEVGSNLILAQESAVSSAENGPRGREEREVCGSVSQEAGTATGFGAGTGPRPGEGSAGSPGKRRSWKGREPRDPASALSQPGLLPRDLLTPEAATRPRPHLPGLPVASPTRCAPTLPTLPLSLPQSSLCGVLGRRARQRELSAPDRGEGRLCPRSMGAGAQAVVYTESTKITEA